jgi:two-component system response regulator RegA
MSSWARRWHEEPRSRCVLIVDPSSFDTRTLATGFRRRAVETWASTDLAGAQTAIATRAPQMVVAELAFPDGNWEDLLALVGRLAQPCAVVLLTARASVAIAVRAVRAGVESVLAKPATADQVLSSVRAEVSPPMPPEAAPVDLTLDQALWEYINRAVELAGSIGGASRALGIERRSLKRMLAKYAPARAATD